MIAFLWLASRGYRLRPWRSPYLRWRIETYSGVPAGDVTAESFFAFLWHERAAMWHHLRWVRSMSGLLRV